MIFKEIQELKNQSLYNREILEVLDAILYSKVYESRLVVCVLKSIHKSH